MVKRIREKIDLILSVVFILIGAFVYHSALDFSRGADVFPKFLAIAIIVLSVLLLAETLRKYRKAEDAKSDKPECGPDGMFYAVRPYIAFLFIGFYIFLIPRVGYFVMTALFVVTVMLLLGVKKILLYLFTLAGLLVGIYGLFVMQLNVPVPRGILF